MAGSERLYTTELLGLAVALADYPLTPDLALSGSARSRTCGSTLDLGLSLDSDGRIARLGLRAHACAVGQAAAAVFARAAAGRSRDDIAAAHESVAQWIEQGGPVPNWPGLAVLAPAREFPARHGALLLPWAAALDALSSAPLRS